MATWRPRQARTKAGGECERGRPFRGTEALMWLQGGGELWWRSRALMWLQGGGELWWRSRGELRGELRPAGGGGTCGHG